MGAGDGRLECLLGVLLLPLVREVTVACSLASSARSSSNWREVGFCESTWGAIPMTEGDGCWVATVGVMVATVGAATSMTRSASSAKLSRGVLLGDDARTILTLAGRRWRKSSLRKDSFKAVLSPRSWCMRRKS